MNMTFVELDPVRERAYHVIVDNFTQEYQTVKDRLQLRQHIKSYPVRISIAIAKGLSKNKVKM